MADEAVGRLVLQVGNGGKLQLALQVGAVAGAFWLVHQNGDSIRRHVVNALKVRGFAAVAMCFRCSLLHFTFRE